MPGQNQIRVQVQCQKRTSVELALSADSGGCDAEHIHVEVSEVFEGGCRIGQIRLSISGDVLDEKTALEMETPIRVFLPALERPENITAMYLFNPWWTRPAFVERLQDIPARTQIAFFKYKDRFACFVPVVGSQFKAVLNGGTETELCLELTARCGGQCRVEEPMYLYSEGSTLAEAVHTAFVRLAEAKKIRLRERRRIPEMFHYLGWCSWDAFRTDVTEDGLRQKAAEFVEKQIPVNWMLIDDGWFTAQEKQLYSFAPDREKFPHGFKDMTADIKADSTVRWFGVWHALGGYWGGVAPESPLASQESAYLYHCANGTVVPSPKTGAGFYNDWYRVLAEEGIDFVKVDGQSAGPLYFENSLPISEAVRGMNEALEGGACRMDGAIINCMGMAMENILARPVSAVSRNSDDFVPGKEDGFAEHLLQNAYNALYHNEIYCCDWDMFWTRHEDAVKHSLLRAISGGPIYFSDRVGDTRPEILKPLAYMDGRVLMMDRSAKPTEDCAFSNPLEGGVLKLHNTASWGGRKGGGIAAYNLTGERQTASFTPADIPELEMCERYWVLDYFRQTVCSLERNESYEAGIEGGGFAWYVILPACGNGTCFGLVDKYAGFSAVESAQEYSGTTIAVLHETGNVGWASWKPPEKVLLNASDLTNKVESHGDFYTLRIPEAAEKAVLSITW